MRSKFPPPRQPAGNADAEKDFAVERYKYILQQIHTLNENVYKFLAVYQTLTTAIVGGGLALFVSYRQWHVKPSTARSGLVALMSLETLVAAFTVLLILIGIMSWMDYRREECELTDKVVGPGFRAQPRVGNFFRWYETYIIAFIAASTIFVWVYGLTLLLPGIT